MKSKDKCVEIQIFDLVTAFDSLWIEDCMNDLVGTLNDENLDDKIALLYKLNKNNLIKARKLIFGVFFRTIRGHRWK